MSNSLELDFEEISPYFIKCETEFFTLRIVFTPTMDPVPAFFQVSIFLLEGMEAFENDSRRLQGKKFLSWELFWNTDIFQKIFTEICELKALDSLEAIVLLAETDTTLGTLAEHKLLTLRE